MSVKVVFEFTHTEDGIDVKHEVVDGGKGGCVCEVAFATQAIEEITTIARKINEAVNTDPTLSWSHAGGVH